MLFDTNRNLWKNLTATILQYHATSVKAVNKTKYFFLQKMTIYYIHIGNFWQNQFDIKCINNEYSVKVNNNNNDIRLTALCLGLPGWAGTRKAKPVWILLKQETVDGSGISWAYASLHLTLFTGRMHFLPPNRQRQSTEGIMV